MARKTLSVFLTCTLVFPWSGAAATRDSYDWSRALGLSRGTKVRLLLKDGASLGAQVAVVDVDSVTVADFSGSDLSKSEKDKALRLIRAGESRVVRIGDRNVDLARIARDIPRTEVRELYKVGRGRSALRVVIGAGLAFLLAIPIAVSIGLSDCGGDCSDEGAKMFAVILGLPIVGGLLGYYAGDERSQLVYQAAR